MVFSPYSDYLPLDEGNGYFTPTEDQEREIERMTSVEYEKEFIGLIED